MERRKKEERRGEETQYGTQRDKELVLGQILVIVLVIDRSYHLRGSIDAHLICV